MKKRVISWLLLFCLLLSGCKAPMNEAAAPDLQVGKQETQELQQTAPSVEPNTSTDENEHTESPKEEDFQIRDIPFETMTAEHHHPKCLDLQVIDPEDKSALIALFNQKEWQWEAMDLYPSLILYIGELRLGYAPESGALTMYGEDAHSVELGEEIKGKVNEILGKYLFLHIDQEYDAFSEREFGEIDGSFTEERWNDGATACRHTAQFPYRELSRKTWYSFGWAEDGSLCGCLHRISKEGAIQNLCLTEWEEQKLLPLLQKYNGSNCYPEGTYLPPGEAALLAREYGADLFGTDMEKFELLRVEPANGGIWWRVFFRSRYGKDAFVQGPVVSFYVTIADRTVARTNLDSEDYSDFDSALLEGLSYDTVIAPEENRLRAEYGDGITDYHPPYARLVKKDGAYKLEYTFLFHAGERHYEQTHYYELN